MQRRLFSTFLRIHNSYLNTRFIISVEKRNDILGERIFSLVNNVVQNAGPHSAIWNGLNSSGARAASGIYIYRIKAGNFISSRKMILLK